MPHDLYSTRLVRSVCRAAPLSHNIVAQPWRPWQPRCKIHKLRGFASNEIYLSSLRKIS
ncbi:hypothetical protein PVAP13_2NG453200 [Panicum virgatum]|uniref:Uncharacterized protein n=1 Tax=Panicum virgatum TaxID=38727 RepID=A0A8T0VCW7_PANVG|nr:hypothetical protein PVAP13_2NG453200 [Panicum virgatum]